MTKPVCIEGVRFFSSPENCIKDFQSKKWTERALSFIASLVNEVKARYFTDLTRFEAQMNSYTSPPSCNALSNKLIVGLHGLNNGPRQFKTIVDEIQDRKNSSLDIYVPHILQKGNAPLDEMVAPLAQHIADWAKSGEDKELVLVGISNGGRIARALEAHLINSGQIGKIKHVRLVSIVGACKGSSMANLAHKIGAARLMTPHIAKEMPTDSERFKQLDEDCEKASLCADVKRDYTFFATPHDITIPNTNSTLMPVSKFSAKYAFIPRHGHDSIVRHVAKSVAAVVLLGNDLSVMDR